VPHPDLEHKGMAQIKIAIVIGRFITLLLENCYVQEIDVFSFGIGPLFDDDSQCGYDYLGFGRLR
jgi:hypothetical protein